MELTKNASSHSQLSYKLEKEHGKVTYLNWRGKTKEDTRVFIRFKSRCLMEISRRLSVFMRAMHA